MADPGAIVKRASLRLRIFLFFAALAIGNIGALGAGLYYGYQRLDIPVSLQALIVGGIVAAFAIAGLTTWVWLLFDENVAKPLQRLTGNLCAGVDASVDAEFDQETARYLGGLAPAAAAVTRQLHRVRSELNVAVSHETRTLVAEKTFLETMLSEIPAAALVCSADHRIVFYNQRAVDVLMHHGAISPLRLDGLIFDWLSRSTIESAYLGLAGPSCESPATDLSLVISGPEATIRARMGRLDRSIGNAVDVAGAYTLTFADFQNASDHENPRVIYDLELLHKCPVEQTSEAALKDLTYVVFDTETTGLRPCHGDEVVQIAAVRVVNGRIIDGETFDVLVNPGRPIPDSSTRIHGINDAMVRDARAIDEVGRQFHAFAKGAVLVAHNAAFDMAFLRLREKDMGCQFDQPILDTVLLSAIIFGQSENHSLDALARRLGILITDEARHTALGDARATAQAFVRLIPALHTRGLQTLGDVQAEAARQRRLARTLTQQQSA